MAQASCPKCPNTSFEMKEHTPKNSNFKLNFVQCTACGAVVSTMDYSNIGDMLDKQSEKIDEIVDGKLNPLLKNVVSISDAILMLVSQIKKP